MTTTPSTKASAKCWIFTKHFGGVGQPTEAEAVELIQHLTDDANYLIYGKEAAPSTGQLHFQGYVQFEMKKRITQLRVLVPQCHFEIAVGSDEDNYVYCSKEGDFVEVGERRDTTGGKRGAVATAERWKRARVAAVSNEMEDVPDDIFIKCYSAIQSIAKDNLRLPADLDGCCGVWIYGPAGVGKSRRAREKYPDAYKKLANKWWDGYKQEDNVILDDFDKAHAMLAYHLKIWADRYGFIGEVKGGALPCRPKKFVITSNYAPEDIWTDEETLGPIRRRFAVLHMRSPSEIGIAVPPEPSPVPTLVLPVEAAVPTIPASSSSPISGFRMSVTGSEVIELAGLDDDE